MKSGDFATAHAEVTAVYPGVEVSFGNDHTYSIYARLLAKQAQAGLDAK